jgi:hypothetical protein
VTNQPDIVNYAKYCYSHYPTIVNNIPKEKTSYDNTLLNYSKIDNRLAAAQLAIGESSNLAQLCLTYTYNYKSKKYNDYVCILSVIAQIAIDNTKRQYSININDEIKRIKRDMNIDKNGYPAFWTIIKKEFNKNRINSQLICPMNYLYYYKFKTFRSNQPTIPMNQFFIKHKLDKERRKCKKVEELIQKYSLLLYNERQIMNTDDNYNRYLLLRDDFDDLLNDIKKIYISKNYAGLMSWLIDRAFLISPNVIGKKDYMNTNTSSNKSILLKVLYTINPNVFLSCFIPSSDDRLD